jgi:predicted kinase
VYSDRMSDRTYTELVQQGLAALATYSGVILDATFSSRSRRDYLRNECAKAHALLQVVELDTEQEEIANRMKARSGTTEEISDARLEDLEKLSTGYEPPLELAPHLIKISTSGSIPDAVKAVLLKLAEKQAAVEKDAH